MTFNNFFSPDDFAADNLDSEADRWADYQEWLAEQAEEEAEEDLLLDEDEDRWLDAAFEDRYDLGDMGGYDF